MLVSENCLVCVWEEQSSTPRQHTHSNQSRNLKGVKPLQDVRMMVPSSKVAVLVGIKGRMWIQEMLGGRMHRTL